jgi:hypothetical protein
MQAIEPKINAAANPPLIPEPPSTMSAGDIEAHVFGV